MKKATFILISILVVSCNLTEEKVPVDAAPNQITSEELVGTWNWAFTEFDTDNYSTCDSFSTLEATTHLTLSFEITEDVLTFSDGCSDASLIDGIYDLKYDDPSYDDGSIVIFDDDSKVSIIFRIANFNFQRNPPEAIFKLTFIQDDAALFGAEYNLEKEVN